MAFPKTIALRDVGLSLKLGLVIGALAAVAACAVVASVWFGAAARERIAAERSTLDAHRLVWSVFEAVLDHQVALRVGTTPSDAERVARRDAADAAILAASRHPALHASAAADAWTAFDAAWRTARDQRAADPAMQARLVTILERLAPRLTARAALLGTEDMEPLDVPRIARRLALLADIEGLIVDVGRTPTGAPSDDARQRLARSVDRLREDAGLSATMPPAPAAATGGVDATDASERTAVQRMVDAAGRALRGEGTEADLATAGALARVELHGTVAEALAVRLDELDAEAARAGWMPGVLAGLLAGGIGLACLAGLAVIRDLRRRLRAATAAAEALTRGVVVLRLEPDGKDEIGALLAGLDAAGVATQRFAHEVSQLAEHQIDGRVLHRIDVAGHPEAFVPALQRLNRMAESRAERDRSLLQAMRAGLAPAGHGATRVATAATATQRPARRVPAVAAPDPTDEDWSKF